MFCNLLCHQGSFSKSCKDKIFDSNTYWWRSCKGKEAVRGEVRVVGVEDEADNADESLPDVVVAVGLAIGEAEEVAHPHGDLGRDPGGQPLQGKALQRRDVGGERVGHHGEEGRPGHCIQYRYCV